MGRKAHRVHVKGGKRRKRNQAQIAKEGVVVKEDVEQSKRAAPQRFIVEVEGVSQHGAWFEDKKSESGGPA